MKTNWMIFLCTALLCSIFSGCSDNDDIEYDSINPLYFDVRIGITNNTGTDLIAEAPKVTKSNYSIYVFLEKDTWSGGCLGDGQEAVSFDSWETYVDGKLVGSSLKDKTLGISFLSYTNNIPKFVFRGYQCVPWCCGPEVTYEVNKANAFYESHSMEHHIVSEYFFGDDKVHIMRVAFQVIPPMSGKVQYDVYLDGKKIEVYYPKGWDMQPTQAEGELKPTDCEDPVMIINVDEF